MGIFIPKLDLRAEETLRWKSWANHARGPLSVGGVLAVTDRRVFFQPNRIESGIRRKPWECPADAVVEVESTDRKPTSWFAGGARRRLEIRTADATEIFVVNKVDRKVAELRDLLGLS